MFYHDMIVSRIVVPRIQYLSQLESYRKNPELIKVITGIRRSGKSELLRQFRQYLLDHGVSQQDVIYVDLEEKRYIIDSERMLYESIHNLIHTKGVYILLDEVQLIRGWERAVDTLRLEFEANIYITGSNSQMTSSELGTHLTGRFVEIHILPFSFREFIVRYPIDMENGYTQRFYQYLRWGGMPIVDLEDDESKNKAILRGVYDSIVNNDIRMRVDLEQGILENVTSFMMANIGNLVSITNITNGALIGDPRTTEKYLSELCKCFVFYKASKYDIIGKKHLRTNAKFYAADTGLRNVVIYGLEYNESALLENVVYLELIRRGYEVFVGSYKTREIDFTAWLNGEPEFYQVVLSLTDKNTLDRETRSFVSMGPDFKRIVITLDREFPEVPEGVKIINVIDWLLDFGGSEYSGTL